MSYVPKPNTGTLWTNTKKTSENHPDIRGDIFIDRALLKSALSKEEELVKLSISGWNKTLGGYEAISVSVSEPWVKQEKPKKPVYDDDEEVPF
jgi:hypothetical protein